MITYRKVTDQLPFHTVFHSPQECGESVRQLVGQVIVIRTWDGSFKVCLCHGIGNDSLLVTYPENRHGDYRQTPFSTLVEHIGPFLEQVKREKSLTLFDLVEHAENRRALISAHAVAARCKEDELYSLDALCQLVGIKNGSTLERLSVALFIHSSPRLFALHQGSLVAKEQTRYSLALDWRRYLEDDCIRMPLNYSWIRRVVEKHLDQVLDYYHCSIQQHTGNVTLSFLIPATARRKYSEQCDAISKALRVTVSVAPLAHESILLLAALSHACMSYEEALLSAQILGARLSGFIKADGEVTTHTLTLYFRLPLVAKVRYEEQLAFIEKLTGWHVHLYHKADERVVVEKIRQLLPSDLMEYTLKLENHEEAHITCIEPPCIPPTEQEVRQRVHEETGWSLEFHIFQPESEVPLPGVLKRNEIAKLAHTLLGHHLRGVHFDALRRTLWLHFNLPDREKELYTAHITELAQKSGWQIEVSHSVNKYLFVETALRVLPEAVFAKEPHFDKTEKRFSLLCAHEVAPLSLTRAQQRFFQETGWSLEVIFSQVTSDVWMASTHMSQAKGEQLLSKDVVKDDTASPTFREGEVQEAAYHPQTFFQHESFSKSGDGAVITIVREESSEEVRAFIPSEEVLHLETVGQRPYSVSTPCPTLPSESLNTQEISHPPLRSKQSKTRERKYREALEWPVTPPAHASNLLVTAQEEADTRKRQIPQSRYSVPIESLALPGHIIASLRLYRVECVGQILEMEEEQFLEMWNEKEGETFYTLYKRLLEYGFLF